MEASSCIDFMQCLGPDMSIKILMCLEDPSDLVRVSSVSTSWRHFVIENGLCKKLCLKMYPELVGVSHVIEAKNVMEPDEFELNNSIEWPCLKRDHRIYAFLARGFDSFMRRDCLFEAICASSTDNYPEESIQNTLEPSDSVDSRVSYWSSEGESNPAVPETLLYKLTSNLCVITEIHVQPFQAFFQFGFPIYSAKAVRFRMGHPKYPMDSQDEAASESAVHGFADKFVWTYTSPEFPMVQENCLQKFTLPEPAICIGGILLVELLGRVQRQEMDGLYYICIAHVQVVGRPLSPTFDVEILDSSGKCNLKYYPEASYCWSPTKSGEACMNNPSRFRMFTASIRGWEQMILNTLLGAGVGVAAGDGAEDAAGDGTEDADDELIA